MGVLTPPAAPWPAYTVRMSAAKPRQDVRDVEVLAFDIFGTVVDWHGSIVRDLATLHPQVDGDAFALAWRAGYWPAMARVMSGELGWTLIDDRHRMILDQILPQFGLEGLDEARRHLNRVWHRLDLAGRSRGLLRLKRKYILCSLSNGNLGLLTRMAKRAGCPGTASCPPKCSVPTSRIRHLPRRGPGVRPAAPARDAGGRPPRRPGWRARAACAPPMSSGRWSSVPPR